MEIALPIWLAALVLAAGSLLSRRAAHRLIATAAGWPTANGRIVTSQILVRYMNGRYYAPQVSYVFEADGVAYASDRLRPGGTPQFLFFRKQATAIVARFPPGSSCIVRYDPRRPAISALELKPQSPWPYLLAVFAAIAAALGLPFALAAT